MSKEIFSFNSDRQEKVQNALFIAAEGLKFVCFLPFMCNPQDVLGRLHGKPKQVFGQLLYESNESEEMKEALGFVPDENVDELAGDIQKVGNLNAFQNGKKPHHLLREAVYKFIGRDNRTKLYKP